MILMNFFVDPSEITLDIGISVVAIDTLRRILIHNPIKISRVHWKRYVFILRIDEHISEIHWKVTIPQHMIDSRIVGAGDSLTTRYSKRNILKDLRIKISFDGKGILLIEAIKIPVIQSKE